MIAAFLSYCRDDDIGSKDIFHKITERLQIEIKKITGDSVRIFRDRNIKLGTLWEKEITINIRRSQFFIIMLTPLYLNSRYCRDEFDLAERCCTAHGHPKLVPISWEPIHKSLRIQSPFYPMIAKYQMIDWTKHVAKTDIDRSFEIEIRSTAEELGRLFLEHIQPSTPVHQSKHSDQRSLEKSMQSHEDRTAASESSDGVAALAEQRTDRLARLPEAISAQEDQTTKRRHSDEMQKDQCDRLTHLEHSLKRNKDRVKNRTGLIDKLKNLD